MAASTSKRAIMSPIRIVMVASSLAFHGAWRAHGERVPALSVDSLLADEWARVGIHDEEFTDRADRVPLRVKPVGHGRASESETCSKLNTSWSRTQDAVRLGITGAMGRSGADRGYQSWGQLE